jgi:endogenous inhibitor of DNA gyrase (YacG/DUF329 family)
LTEYDIQFKILSVMNCSQCGTDISSHKKWKGIARKFCDSSCAAIYNNRNREYEPRTKKVNCPACGKELTVNKSCSIINAKYFCCTLTKNDLAKAEAKIRNRAKNKKRAKAKRARLVSKLIKAKRQPKILLQDSVRIGARVYGPYKRVDGRKHVCIIMTDRTRVVVSYPKWLMEQHLGRLLDINETVDHKDCDFTNDSIDNLQILDRSTHSKLDAKRILPIKVICVWCEAEFMAVMNGSRDRKDHIDIAGPFCSRKCSGEYGAAIQNSKIERLGKWQGERQYYKLKHSNDNKSKP